MSYWHSIIRGATKESLELTIEAYDSTIKQFYELVERAKPGERMDAYQVLDWDTLAAFAPGLFADLAKDALDIQQRMIARERRVSSPADAAGFVPY